jgi:ABC-type amino acid transport system permease subunit
MATSARPDDRPPFYRDTRFAGILVQGLFLVALLLVAWFIYSNMMTRLAAGSSASQSLRSVGAFLIKQPVLAFPKGLPFARRRPIGEHMSSAWSTLCASALPGSSLPRCLVFLLALRVSPATGF